MTYHLDSNIIIAILKGKGPATPEWADRLLTMDD